MFSFNFSQILGLLMFFIGLIILNRCSAVERMDYMARSLPETLYSARPDSDGRKMSRQLVRQSIVYSLMGVFVSMGGMALFFISAS